MKTLTKTVLALSAALFFLPPAFASDKSLPPLVIPSEVQMKLMGNGDIARIKFEYGGQERIFWYHIKTDWQDGLEGDFDLTEIFLPPSLEAKDSSSESYIPEEMHIELRNQKKYTAKMKFRYGENDEIVNYLIDLNLKLVIYRDFDLKEFSHQEIPANETDKYSGQQ